MKETAAISYRIAQPIFKFGILLQKGWTIWWQSANFDLQVWCSCSCFSTKQSTDDSTWDPCCSRKLAWCEFSRLFLTVCWVDELGGEFDDMGCGVGRQCANECQDRNLVKPPLTMFFCSTTLREDDDKKLSNSVKGWMGSFKIIPFQSLSWRVWRKECDYNHGWRWKRSCGDGFCINTSCFKGNSCTTWNTKWWRRRCSDRSPG